MFEILEQGILILLHTMREIQNAEIDSKNWQIKQLSPQRDKIKLKYLGFSKCGKEDKRGGGK